MYHAVKVGITFFARNKLPEKIHRSMTIKINERDSADIFDLMSASYAGLHLIAKCPKLWSLKVKINIVIPIQPEMIVFKYFLSVSLLCLKVCS